MAIQSYFVITLEEYPVLAITLEVYPVLAITLEVYPVLGLFLTFICTSSRLLVLLQQLPNHDRIGSSASRN